MYESKEREKLAKVNINLQREETFLSLSENDQKVRWFSDTKKERKKKNGRK